MDGWNRGSGDLFAAPFADDADLVGFDGTWRLEAFQNTRAQFLGRPEEARALTEELRELL